MAIDSIHFERVISEGTKEDHRAILCEIMESREINSTYIMKLIQKLDGSDLIAKSLVDDILEVMPELELNYDIHDGPRFNVKPMEQL